MNKETNPVLDFIFRYSSLLIVGIFSNSIFYFLFTFLTVYPVFFLLNLLFDNVVLMSNIILINQIQIEIVGSCVASSAYFLLLMLNLSTPKINISKRFGILFLTFVTFLIANVLRIVLLSLILVNQSQFFDITHKLFWYSISTLFVVSIWFLTVKLFKIKEIPFYSDLKFLLQNVNKKTKISRKKSNNSKTRKTH
jgi:exosortase/archaeosortase family protein